MNNKKITITFILIATMALLGIVGFTIAYFTSSVDFENEFNTGNFETTATETFTSPENWLPGDTTPKTLVVTNTGNVDVKARVCITEEWTSSSGDPLDNEVNGERVAILNLTNTSDWTKKGNCYEYNDVLEPNDVTNSFISGVTFNPNIEADVTCVPTISNGTITQTCTSRGDGYDDATYTLTFTVETIQSNIASTIWPTSGTRYTNSTSRIGDIPPNTLYNNPANLINANNYQVYLKHSIVDGVISESYIEFNVTEEMVEEDSNMTLGTYSIEGAGSTYNSTTHYYNNDSLYYEDNVDTLTDAFGASNCEESPNNYKCDSESIHALAFKSGLVSVEDDGYVCQVYANGLSRCDYSSNIAE